MRGPAFAGIRRRGPRSDAVDQVSLELGRFGWGRPAVLAELEALLTGRDSQEIAADPKHGAQVTEIFSENAGVVEAGLVTVTDMLTRALAVAD